jgi:hypothetical protein
MKKLLQIIVGWWHALKWWWTGGVLNAQLQDRGSPQRSEAQEAVDRIVRKTRLAADTVASTVLRGGAAILVLHDEGQEAFIGRSYAHAADKVIEWANQREGRYVQQRHVSRMSQQGARSTRVRAQRRHRRHRRH